MNDMHLFCIALQRFAYSVNFVYKFGVSPLKCFLIWVFWLFTRQLQYHLLVIFKLLNINCWMNY